jgi:hypothetical protein
MVTTANVLIGWPNRMAQLTPSGGAWSAALPLSGLTTDYMSEKAQSQTADKRNTWFYLTATAGAVAAMVFALAGHNMTTAGQYRLRGFNTANPKSFVFTGNELPAGITLTRAGATGTYFGTDGLLKTAAADVPRFDYDPATGKYRGLLIECATTNQFTWSRDGTNAAWNKSASMAAALTAAGIDGVGNTATRLTANAANQRISRAAASAGVVSVYLRRVTGAGAIRTTNDNFATTPDIAAQLTTSWKRFTVAMDGVGTTFGIQIDTSGDVIEMDFAQYEIGLTAPTMPVYTAGATATRNADVVNTTAATAGISSTAGTMMARGVLEARPASGNVAGIGLSDVTGASGTNFVGLKITSAGVATANVKAATDQADNAGVTLAAGDAFAMAMAWGTNDVRSSFNGAAAVSDATATMPGALATFHVNRYGSGAGGALWLQQLHFWPTALADADLVSLSGAEAERVATFDTGLRPAWRAAYVAATSAERRAGMPGLAGQLFDAQQTFAYWRVDMDDEANPAGMLEAAVPMLTDGWQPTINAERGLQIGFEDRALTTKTASGAKNVTELPNPRVFPFTLAGLSNAEALDELFELARIQGTTRPVLFSLMPTDDKQWHRVTFVATMRRLNRLEAAGKGIWREAFEVEEAM